MFDAQKLLYMQFSSCFFWLYVYYRFYCIFVMCVTVCMLGAYASVMYLPHQSSFRSTLNISSSVQRDSHM